MEGLTLLDPPNCPASWPVSLVERVSAEPVKKATLAGLTTPVKHKRRGETIDCKHPDYSQDQNIGLYDIVSLASMRKVERSGQTTVWGKSIKGSVDYGYCPLCPYASQNHRTLKNHVRLHFWLSMVCGMPDCWYVTHSVESM